MVVLHVIVRRKSSILADDFTSNMVAHSLHKLFHGRSQHAIVLSWGHGGLVSRAAIASLCSIVYVRPPRSESLLEAEFLHLIDGA
jgi:hypothetical protein